jgi:type VI secretion system secreted protein VgrG
MTQARSRFLFTSQALDEETFEVVRFRGSEGVSRLYEFDITLVSEDPEVDFRSVLRNPATLTILRQDEDPRIVHGMVFQFEQLHEDAHRIFYRAILAPRLKQADLYRENQLFLDKSVPDIIEEILSQARLTTDDYELRLTRSYEPWEYICQYGETDFNFISRWMEREGIYYYFEQTEEFEKLIITDSSSSHEDIPGTSTVEYHPPSSMTSAREPEVVTELLCRQRMLPRRVVLRDYNYRRPSLELRGEAEVDPQGLGDVNFYGDHFKTPEEGNLLAGIRAEEILCRERVFSGEGTVPTLCPGFLFQVSGHYRDSYNQRFLITEMVHEGSQAHAMFGAEAQGDNGSLERAYVNRFECIPGDLQFRPERTTPKPQFYGTMTARVDGAGDGPHAEIDEEGRYKVRLAFDQSDRSGGTASRWVRMAQPFAGPNYGMHFPLHRGVEVLLTFVNGDPDRPIISGSVPNPETASPVNAANSSQHAIRTSYGHEFIIDDANPHVEITTRHGCRIRSDDSGDVITIITPAGFMFESSDTDQTIIIATPSLQEEITLAHGSYAEMVSGSNYLKAVETGGHVEIHAEQDIGVFVVQGSKDMLINQTDIQLNMGGSHQLMKNEFIQFENGGSCGMRIESNQINLWCGFNSIQISADRISINHGSKIELWVGASKITLEEAQVTVTGSKINLNC